MCLLINFYKGFYLQNEQRKDQIKAFNTVPPCGHVVYNSAELSTAGLYNVQ